MSGSGRHVHGVDRAELAALLALLAAPGLPQSRVLALLCTHGSARSAFAALERECGADTARLARSPAVRRRTQHALHAIETGDIVPIPWGSASYPPLLAARLDDHAPPILFARGDIGALTPTGVGVVGCRRASEYGLDMAEQIGAGVARAGGCVVSGLARGIDAAAHAAALEAGGTTIAVLGCGVDVYYPQQNMALQDRIAATGLLLSEFLPGDHPRRYYFPHRNRIIAALSEAVVVVEAGEDSGAVRTAEHAMTMGVPTFGVPNAVDRPGTQGILALFRDGVLPFTGLRDLLEHTGLVGLGTAPPPAAPDSAPEGGPEHGRVWAVLGAEPLHVDAIAAAAALPSARALGVLLELELDGRVRQLPGGRFSRPRAPVRAPA